MRHTYEGTYYFPEAVSTKYRISASHNNNRSVFCYWENLTKCFIRDSDCGRSYRREPVGSWLQWNTEVEPNTILKSSNWITEVDFNRYLESFLSAARNNKILLQSKKINTGRRKANVICWGRNKISTGEAWGRGGRVDRHGGWSSEVIREDLQDGRSGPRGVDATLAGGWERGREREGEWRGQEGWVLIGINFRNYDFYLQEKRNITLKNSEEESINTEKKILTNSLYAEQNFVHWLSQQYEMFWCFRCEWLANKRSQSWQIWTQGMRILVALETQLSELTAHNAWPPMLKHSTNFLS